MPARIPSIIASLLAISAVLIAFAGVSLRGSFAANDATVEEFIAEQDERLARKLDRYDIPGISVAMVHNGEIVWVEGYGEADRSTGAPVTPHTVFESGSIAKSLTAWGVMRLVETGRIELDAPVERYLERWEFPEADFPTDGVTVRRLLSNSSGLPAVIHFPSIDGLLAGEPDRDEIVPQQRPGEGFIYSNPGWVLIALMIEDVTGQSYPEFMRQEVLEPLGMVDSGFGWDADFSENAATGYTFGGNPVPADEHGPYGAGSLYSTAEDLARFAQSSIDAAAGGALHPDSVDLMHMPVVDVSGGYHGLMSESYGFGHFIEELPNGNTGITHGGESGGWLTAYYLVPESGDGLVMMSNSRRSWPLVNVLDDWAEWRGFPSTVMTRSYGRLETGVTIAIGAFGLGTVVLVGILARAFWTGGRRFVPASRDSWPWRMIQMLLAIVLLLGWWLLAREIAGPFFPVLTAYLGIALTAYSILLMLMAVTVPRSARRLIDDSDAAG